MTPFFSIIIPVYNVAPYLRECLDSVLGQTFTDWEVICVDDGSTDGSGAILYEYAAKDSRFRVVHQTNEGVSAARNAALDVAKGRWILFLDADDFWHQKLLSTIVAMINAYPGEKLFRFGYEHFENEFHQPRIDEVGAGFYVVDISKEISMHDFFYFYFCCHAYRRDLLDGIRFPRYIRGEDRCVLNKIQLERANAIVVTNSKLYGYRNRAGSAMNTVPSRQVLCDEMDHRLDIMEMIDRSRKTVRYKGDRWLEKFFTTSFYAIVGYKSGRNMFLARKERIARFCKCKDISISARLISTLVTIFPFYWIDFTLCYILPKSFVGMRRLCRIV
jgi:glycosyltransferase involved in cell wall biosynthesis